MLLASDFNMPSDYYNDIRVGAEVRAHPNVSLRLGYRHEFGTANDPATGMSFGLGFNFQQLNVDYAMTPSNDFDDVHRLSFGYSFGRGAVREEQEPKKKPEEKKPAAPAGSQGPAGECEGGASGRRAQARSEADHDGSDHGCGACACRAGSCGSRSGDRGDVDRGRDGASARREA